MADCGVNVLKIVSPIEEEQQFPLQGVSYDCESSFSFPSILPWWLLLWYNPDDATLFASTEASKALLRWVCTEVSKRGGTKKVLFGDE